MFLPIAGAALLLIDMTSPIGPHPRRDAIFSVATAQAVALVASAQCRDILVTTDLGSLNEALGLTNADLATITSETATFVQSFSEQVRQAGAAAWCDDVYARFGPDGAMMKGLLKRCDAHNSSC